jgi:hypothetical protein
MFPSNSVKANSSRLVNSTNSMITCAAGRSAPGPNHFFALIMLTSHLPAPATLIFALSTI